jgi:hypothetical protein
MIQILWTQNKIKKLNYHDKKELIKNGNGTQRRLLWEADNRSDWPRVFIDYELRVLK